MGLRVRVQKSSTVVSSLRLGVQNLDIRSRCCTLRKMGIRNEAERKRKKFRA